MQRRGGPYGGGEPSVAGRDPAQVRKKPVAARHPGFASRLGPRVASALAICNAEYCCSALSPRLISARVGLTPAHLCRAFRREVGVSLPDYLRRLRIQRAEELLRDPAREVKEVAAEAGFGCTKSFERAFGAAHSLTPSAYRRRLASCPPVAGLR